MKRIIISAALVLSAGAAHADPITVMAPRPGASAEEKAAYVIKLEHAVKEVCNEAASPVIGVNYYAYMECLKATRIEVARKDPTGLYATRDSGGTVVAAK